MQFKDRLAKVLRDRGLTQKDFAAHVGVDPTAVGGWLLGREPRVSLYERILVDFPELRADAEHRAAAS